MTRLGIIFLAIGAATANAAFLLIGFVFLALD